MQVVIVKMVKTKYDCEHEFSLYNRFWLLIFYCFISQWLFASCAIISSRRVATPSFERATAMPIIVDHYFAAPNCSNNSACNGGMISCGDVCYYCWLLHWVLYVETFSTRSSRRTATAYASVLRGNSAAKCSLSYL